ncbi:ctr copper transporter family protein [Colletotrichum asianum]|uniref:Ctr copper transporter family protein n=1 Tax=Colletotrichum asianum TaxID=702518 RepID=A0A8H3ZV21_9PEZI|nr:ctr copper transporter family protein [Colletotrichum asianum]
MKLLLVPGFLSFLGLSAAFPRRPFCSSVSINVTAEAANVVFEGLPDRNNATAIIEFLASSFDATRTQHSFQQINGTFTIRATHCRPRIESTNPKSLQLLVHGITYDRAMWSGFGFPQYDWQTYATSLGYHTLAIDRLGHGIESPHPDPFAVVQGPLEVEIIHSLLHTVRQGRSKLGDLNKIIYVGHSYRSSLGNMLAQKHPLDVDAFILTGFSGDLGTSASALSAYGDAAMVSSRFKGLPLGYLTVVNESDRTASFYGGNFDPSFAALDYDTEDTVTVGELLSPGLQPVETDYRGNVLVMTGDLDVLFCPGGPDTCADALRGTESLFSNATFSSVVVLNTGHCLTLHLSAPLVMENAHTWLHGLQH